MAADSEALKRLAEPTPDEEKKSRPAPGGSGKMLTYIDARYVMDRLDEVVGPANWQQQFREVNGGVVCGLGIYVQRDGALVGAEWVWKWDVGTESTIEATKGNYSDALKRAAVSWGIARDLYDDRSAAPGSFRVAGSGVASPGSSSDGGGVGAPVSPRLASAPLVSDWTCPIHGSYKVVPAGTSSRTGRAYPAFVVCGQTNCEQKPPRGAGAPKPAPVYAGMSEYPLVEEEFDPSI